MSYLPAGGDISTPVSKSVNGLDHDKSVSSSPFPVDASTPQSSLQNSNAPPPYSNGHENQSANADQSGLINKSRAAIASVVPTSGEDLKAQLAEAQATIGRLTQQLDQGIRQRTSGLVSQEKGGTRMSTMAVGSQQNGPAGVPVQVVAGLCLLSFLLAYFFF